MTKKDMVALVLAETETTNARAAGAVDALFGALKKHIVKHGKLTIVGFGSFIVRSRKARLGRNPQTGEAVKIKASKTVGFRPSSELKAKL